MKQKPVKTIIFFMLLCLLCSCVSLPGQTGGAGPEATATERPVTAVTPVVAVAPFEARAGISASDAETITEVYSIRLSATRSVRVVNREALDRVVEEHRFQEKDWSDDRKTAVLGNALNADWVVRGTLQTLNNRMIVTVLLLDVKTLEVKGGADMRLNGIDDAYDRMNDLVAQTVATMTGERGPISGTDTYKVGDQGPGGGIVFFAREGRYMEVSEFLGAYNWNNALIAARNYIGGGFSDWRLPSKDELNLIYINLGTRNIGNLGHSYHWSSTQFNTESAWVQMLIGGSEQGTNYKRNAVSVRAVRDF